MAVWQPVLEFDEIIEGGINKASAGGFRLILLQIEGELYAYEDACPHERHPLSLGEFEGDILTCAKHLWEFEVRTAEPLSSVAYNNPIHLAPPAWHSAHPARQRTKGCSSPSASSSAVNAAGCERRADSTRRAAASMHPLQPCDGVAPAPHFQVGPTPIPQPSARRARDPFH